MKGHTFHAAIKQLAFISVGNLILSWLGLVWKESKQHSNRGRSTPTIPPLGPDPRGEATSSSFGNAPLKVPNRIRL